MSTEIRTVRYFWIKCDGCGARASEDALSEDEAKLLAGEAGWEHLSKWNGLMYYQRDFCPDCFQKWEAEQEQKSGQPGFPWREPDHG